MQPYILINPFEVPQGHEAEFLEDWGEAAEYLRRSPGFISARLHQSLDPNAKFRFVNIAEWETLQHFQAAVGSEAFQEIARSRPFAGNPALYRVSTEVLS